MTSAPVTDGAARRTIGDILLAHGFVTQEALAEATAEQERTAQPLGQILVQQGVITRLELASALAEQWSDPSASITMQPRPPAGPRPAAVAPHDDDQYAARLQDAVADLARRVQANQPLEGIDERVADLAQRIEATLARTQRIEATVATLADGLEGVTTGVEEAFTALQSGTAELALELARIDRCISELAARPSEQPAPDPLLVAELEELRAAVTTLSERPQSDDDARARIEEIAGRLDTLVDASALDDLRGALHELEGRPATNPDLEARLDRVEATAAAATARPEELDAHAAILADLQATLDELAARPAGSPDLDARLERIETQLAQTGVPAADPAMVEELSARLEVAMGSNHDLAATIVALEARLDEIAARPTEDPAARTGLAELEQRLNAVTDGDLQRFASTLEAMQHEIEALRGPDGQVTIDVEELLARIGELESNAAVTGSLGATVESIEARLPLDPVQRDDLHEAIARARDELGASVDQLRTELASADDNGLAQRVEDLMGRMDALVAGPSTPELAERLSSLEQELASRHTPASSDRDLELAHKLESLSATVDRLVATTAEQTGRDELGERLDLIETRRKSDVETLEILATALDRMREDLMHGATVVTTSPAPIDEAALQFEARLKALEELGERLTPTDEPRVTSNAEPAEIEGELERIRMAIERVGLHLGEHDRALADLLKARGVSQRLDELAARVEEIAEAGAGGSAQAGPAFDVSGDMRALMQRVEEAESSSQADRERLMSRLERMASSIDWRLQRLETDETAE